MDQRIINQMLAELPKGSVYVGFWKPDAECKCCQAIWPCRLIRAEWKGRYNLVNRRYSVLVPKTQPNPRVENDVVWPEAPLYDVVTGECWFMVPTLEEQVLTSLAGLFD